jgi:hypothetical protein
MKKLKLFMAIGLMGLLCMVGCKGPEGPVGPQGATGAAGKDGGTGAVGPQGATGAAGKDGGTGAVGPQGATGAAGKDGNANVLQISYDSKTHNGNTDLFLAFPTTISTEVVDKSLFYVYLKKKVKSSDDKEYDYWFPVPGETNTGNEYSYYVFAGNATLSAGLYLKRVVNYFNGDETFNAIRVVVIPANNSVSGGRKANIDFRNYEQVRKTFNLPE